MTTHLPRLFLTRHGDTPWTDSRQHTGRTDLALNARGEHNARQIGERLRKNYSFAHVLTSPLQRAAKTCELAGFGDRAEIDADLVEWDYGSYEGKRGKEIRAGQFGAIARPLAPVRLPPAANRAQKQMICALPSTGQARLPPAKNRRYAPNVRAARPASVYPP